MISDGIFDVVEQRAIVHFREKKAVLINKTLGNRKPPLLPFVRISVVINCLLLTVSPMKPISITECRKNLPTSGLAEVFRQCDNWQPY